MATNSTLLCIHRDPAQLSLLRDHGYRLLTASTGHEGLRLLSSQSVDAIVLEYQLGLLDGAFIASEIKQILPKIPIVMVADPLELPEDALKSVDVMVATSDGPHFVWAAVHFLLNSNGPPGANATVSGRARLAPRPGATRKGRVGHRSAELAPSPYDKESPFSAEVWESVRKGTIKF